MTNDERVQLIKENNLSLMNLVELDFEVLLFSQKLNFYEINCFKKHEVLKGLMVADLLINDMKKLKW